MKKTTAILLVLVMALSLCACGARYDGANSAVYKNAYDYEEYAAYEPAAVRGAGLAMNASYSLADTALDEGYEVEEQADAPTENPDKIIYSANVTVESTAFEESLAKLDELVARCGGWVESSSVSGSNYSDISRGSTRTRSASYTLRIPSERFDELMHSLSELGNVPYTYLYTENVSAQYYDVQARLTAAQTQEARLLEMMAVAESVEDIILLEDRLSELRYQIESLQSKLRGWDRRVSYSTVSLELREVREYTPETPITITYGERLARAWRGGLESVGEFFQDFLLWFVEAIPTLAILAALAFALYPLGRKLVRRGKERAAARRAKRAEKKAAKAPSNEG